MATRIMTAAHAAGFNAGDTLLIGAAIGTTPGTPVTVRAAAAAPAPAAPASAAP